MLHFLGRSSWLLYCWLELTAFTLFLYLLAWLPRSLTQYFYSKLFYIWCRFFVRALGVNLRLHQKNKQPLPKQYILVANHPSAFEDIGVPALFDVHPLAKMGVKKWFLLGKISEAAGTMFVKRDSKESRSAVVDEIIKKLDSGESIVIFPEGGCKGRRIFEKFQYGAFDISIKTGIPILPVFLHYEAQDRFEWRDPQILIEKFWHFMTSQNNKANYYVYDAFDPKDFKDKQEYSEHVLNKFLEWQKRYLD
ncbi:MAG: lysophospholipid acyltransferase family protein [Woeseiaceae bacterium]